MSIEQIKNEIERIREDESKLYSYLYDLTYKEGSKNIRFLESIYTPFLADSRSEIKRVTIYCLLFGLQIRKPELKIIALNTLRNRLNDIDLRSTCIMGLAQAYMATDDKDLLSVFGILLENEEEDNDIRTESFVGMMKLHGLTSAEILNKNNDQIIISISDIHLDRFEKELSEIHRILS